LPSGVTFLSFTAVNATCTTNVAETVVSCTGGSLTNGEVSSVTIRVRANTSGLFTNNVTTRATSPVDLNLANNTNSVVLQVVSGASIAILRRDPSIVLGWPTNRTGFRLFSTPDIGLPAWTRITNAPSSFLDYNVLTQQVSGAGLLYRLER
jgi:hypothetical protein